MIATHFSFLLTSLSLSAHLISVSLRGRGGRGRWRGENYAQWDTWWKQFEIEMSTTYPALYPSKNSLRTHFLSLSFTLRERNTGCICFT